MVSFRYIIPVFCLFFLQAGQAQNVPWNTPSVSLVSVPLVIDCNPLVDGQSLTEGDYIGIFSDSDRCFGLARWKDTTNFKIIVYGADGSTEGFNAGDKLTLKLWLRNEDCILEHISQVSSDSPLVFSNTASNRVNVLNFERVAVSYASESYCLNAGDTIVPRKNYDVNDMYFTSGDGLQLENSTGKIDLAGSQPGVYAIMISSGICIAEKNLGLTLHDYPRLENIPDTFICGDRLSLTANVQNQQILWSTGDITPRVELNKEASIWYKITSQVGCSNTDTFEVKRISIANLTFATEKADCYEKGRLQIMDQEIINGKPPYTYRLANQLDTSEISDLGHIPEGIYIIEVINRNGCILQYNMKVTIEKDCLDDNPVFSPNQDGLDDRYFINLEGKLEIFDRNGVLKRRLTGPCYFDGNDENGNPLPMGAYIVVSGKKESMVLTIIR